MKDYEKPEIEQLDIEETNGGWETIDKGSGNGNLNGLEQ